MKPHRGVLVLVLGILSLVICQPIGVAAWIMGSGDLKQMDAGQMDPAGRGLTAAGKICGIVAVVLFGISIVVGVLLLALGIFSAAATAR